MEIAKRVFNEIMYGCTTNTDIKLNVCDNNA